MARASPVGVLVTASSLDPNGTPTALRQDLLLCSSTRTLSLSLLLLPLLPSSRQVEVSLPLSSNHSLPHPPPAGPWLRLPRQPPTLALPPPWRAHPRTFPLPVVAARVLQGAFVGLLHEACATRGRRAFSVLNFTSHLLPMPRTPPLLSCPSNSPHLLPLPPI